MFSIIGLQDQKLFRTINATTEIVGCTNSHDDYTNCIILLFLIMVIVVAKKNSFGAVLSSQDLAYR